MIAAIHSFLSAHIKNVLLFFLLFIFLLIVLVHAFSFDFSLRRLSPSLIVTKNIKYDIHTLTTPSGHRQDAVWLDT